MKLSPWCYCSQILTFSTKKIAIFSILKKWKIIKVYGSKHDYCLVFYPATYTHIDTTLMPGNKTKSKTTIIAVFCFCTLRFRTQVKCRFQWTENMYTDLFWAKITLQLILRQCFIFLHLEMILYINLTQPQREDYSLFGSTISFSHHSLWWLILLTQIYGNN